MTASGSGRQTPKTRILGAIGLVAVGLVLGLGVGRWMDSKSELDEELGPSEMERAVRSAMTEISAFERSTMLIRVFQRLDAENVDGAVRGMRTRSEYLDPVDLQLLLSAWTRFDPDAAMREAANWPSQAGREIGMRVVMREWAASGRVIEAGHYYQNVRNPETRSIVAGPLIRGWALSGDTEGALKRVQIFWDQGEPGNAVDGFVRGALTSVGTEKLIEQVLALDPSRGGKLEHRLTRVTFSLGASANPQAIGAAYASLEGDQPPDWMKGALQDISRSWPDTDPDGAIEWLLERVETPERAIALKEMMRAWSIRDLDAAWSWWATEDEGEAIDKRRKADLRTILLPPVLRRMARVRPVEASRWVEAVENPAAKEVLMLRVAYFMAYRDRLEAERWVASLGLAEPLAQRAREVIARGAERRETLEDDEENGDSLPFADPE